MHIRRNTILLALCLAIIASVATGPVLTAAGQTAGDSNDRVAATLHLTPDTPGEIKVEVSIDTSSISGDRFIKVDERARIVSTSGLYKHDPSVYEITDSSSASITYYKPANVTRGGRYQYVDTGSWAIVAAPDLPIYRRDGTVLPVPHTYHVAGEGRAGSGIAYLGPHTTYTASTNQQRFTLIVPDAATLPSNPKTILNTLKNASNKLAVGAVDDSTLAIAAPTTIPYAYVGTSGGDDSFWVVANQPGIGRYNSWVHEYVHTRQTFKTNRETQWLVEATAEYYMSYLPLKSGQMNFGSFSKVLAHGEDRSAVLSQPDTWNPPTPYTKGALVIGVLDKQIRRETDGSASFMDVFKRLNAHEGVVTQADFLEIVEDVASREVAATAKQYATSTSTPEMWTLSEHKDAFGWEPSDVTVTDTTVTATGPEGERSITGADGGFTVSTAETVSFTKTLRNTGDIDAVREAWATVDSTREMTNVVTVEADGTATVTFSHQFEETGWHSVNVWGDTYRVRALEPSTRGEVTEISVTPDPVRPGDQVTISAKVVNPTDTLVTQEVTLAVDGESIATVDVRLEPGHSTRIERTITVDEPGEHSITAGETTVTFAAVTPTPTPTATPDGQTSTDAGQPTQTAAASSTVSETAQPTASSSTPTSAPGFTALAALLGLVLVVGAASRAR